MTAQGILVPTRREYSREKHRALDPKEEPPTIPHTTPPTPIPFQTLGICLQEEGGMQFVQAQNQ